MSSRSRRTPAGLDQAGAVASASGPACGPICSSANCVFFEAQALAAQEPPDRVPAHRDAFARQLLLQSVESQVRRRRHQRHSLAMGSRSHGRSSGPVRRCRSPGSAPPTSAPRTRAPPPSGSARRRDGRVPRKVIRGSWVGLPVPAHLNPTRNGIPPEILSMTGALDTRVSSLRVAGSFEHPGIRWPPSTVEATCGARSATVTATKGVSGRWRRLARTAHGFGLVRQAHSGGGCADVSGYGAHVRDKAVKAEGRAQSKRMLCPECRLAAQRGTNAGAGGGLKRGNRLHRACSRGSERHSAARSAGCPAGHPGGQLGVVKIRPAPGVNTCPYPRRTVLPRKLPDYRATNVARQPMTARQRNCSTTMVRSMPR